MRPRLRLIGPYGAFLHRSINTPTEDSPASFRCDNASQIVHPVRHLRAGYRLPAARASRRRGHPTRRRVRHLSTISVPGKCPPASCNRGEPDSVSAEVADSGNQPVAGWRGRWLKEESGRQSQRISLAKAAIGGVEKNQARGLQRITRVWMGERELVISRPAVSSR